jgi:hypothetical protein
LYVPEIRTDLTLLLMAIYTAGNIRCWWRRFRCRFVVSQALWVLILTDIGLTKVLLLAVVLWMLFSES